ncbi:NAD(P)H-binding protein [Polyangium aurulentum]|uniref:NAD(P)H-binding protein n=1 Tax=Polyangium aurulentum TaxID=2567896 RepID=UPI0010ADF8CC|nr:NAD(P)H-binding protein [Polyangium aurulentum]UQA57721.1 NAD(P)H-binding protein [Polyangium aurulentum]
MKGRTALLVGATGLVGGHCLTRLVEAPEYERVRVLVRRPLGRGHEKIDERVVDFDKLADLAPAPAVDDVFVCLGTTIKAAGSKEAFARVDHDYVVAAARLGRQGGAKRLCVVSSVGADSGSANFYLRVKGEAERDLEALGFEVLEVLRPSLLVGERQEQRVGEKIAIALTSVTRGLMLGPLRAYRPIEAKSVAAALVGAALRGKPGVHVRTHDEILELARAV